MSAGGFIGGQSSRRRGHGKHEDEGRQQSENDHGEMQAEQGRVSARPVPPTEPAPQPGLHPLDLGTGRPALLYVPEGLGAGPAPVAVMLHGAGARPPDGIALLRAEADRSGVVLLAPSSHGRTWDVILGEYGDDVDLLDRGLRMLFARQAVDPARLAVGGFSDGASYALCIGLTNGDLFSHILAFSPGFSAPAARQGSPRVFVSHGKADGVLPIDVCSRRIVPRLQNDGYDVLYREFDGGHSVPPEIVAEAAPWFLGA